VATSNPNDQMKKWALAHLHSVIRQSVIDSGIRVSSFGF
jgi:hypothetical protein